MPRSRPVLTTRDLPGPELAGMLRDGEIYPLADAWCSIDVLETPAHRAAAALGDHPPRLIAELGTAAWIWGAVPAAPAVAEFCVDVSARARVRATPLLRVREVVLEPRDRVALGDAVATSPLRTAIDLARFRDALDERDAASIRELARLGGFGLDDCLDLVESRRNLPAKRRAVDRLRALLG